VIIAFMNLIRSALPVVVTAANEVMFFLHAVGWWFGWLLRKLSKNFLEKILEGVIFRDEMVWTDLADRFRGIHEPDNSVFR